MTDFEYELHIAQTNKVIMPEIDTMFLVTSLNYAYLSSTTVRELASFKSDVSVFVPPAVVEALNEKYAEKGLAEGDL
jgi:pantetheine-phosphate adenylyltransferase